MVPCTVRRCTLRARASFAFREAVLLHRDDANADSPLWLITSAITTEEIDLLPNGSTPAFGMFYAFDYVIKYDETARAQMSYNKPSWIKTNNVFSISTEPTDMSSHGDYVSNQINEDFNPQQEEPWF